MGYSIAAYAGVNAAGSISAPANATSAQFNGLNNGTSYTFTVAALNAVGTGPASSASNAVTPQATATVWSLSGTVAYAGAKTGRIYIRLFEPSGSGGRTEPLGGTSLAAPGAFTISGLRAAGGFELHAFMDTTGRAVQVASVDPAAMTAVQSGGANVTGANLSLTDPVGPVTLAPAAPQARSIVTATNFAMAMFDPPHDINQHDTATSVVVDAVTEPGGATVLTRTVHAGAQPFALLAPLAAGSYRARYTATNPQGSSASVLSAPFLVGPSAGGQSVSGTISLSGVTATGPLYVYAYNATGGVYLTRVTSPSASTPFTVPNVPPGNYVVGAFVDQNDDGELSVTEPATVSEPVFAMTATVAGAPVTGLNATLSPNASLSSLTTASLDGAWSLRFLTQSGSKLPVAARIVSGPQVSAPVDIGLSNDRNSGHARYALAWSLPGQSSPPLFGETYGIQVTYADGSTALTSASVTGVPQAPVPVAPSGPIGSTTPTFSWGAPAQLPQNPWSYAVYVERTSSSNGPAWFIDGLASTQVAYNANGTATETPGLSGSQYRWGVMITDGAGNQATATKTFSLPVQVTVIPASATIGTGQTKRFSASLSSASDQSVSWQVTPLGAGTIDATGLFTPAMSGGPFTITAHATQDGSTGTAQVTVTSMAQLNISITPGYATVPAGGQQSLTATVFNPGAGGTGSTFSLVEPSCGSITSGGNYTAPSSPGTCHAVAATTADPNVKAACEIYVVTPATHVTGTASYGGTSMGRVYLSLRADAPAGPARFGHSLASPGAFDISARLQPGSYTLEGFIDTAGTGRFARSADPYGSVGFSTQGGDVTGLNLVLSNPGPSVPTAPSFVSALGGNGFAYVHFSPTVSVDGYETATKYTVSLSTSPAFTVGTTTSVDVSPGAKLGAAVIAAAPGSYYAAVTSWAGNVESTRQVAMPSPFNVGGVGTGTSSIDGQVSFSGAAPAGPLYLIAEGANGVYLTRFVSPSYPQAYSLPASPGQYRVNGFVDVNANGSLDPNEPALLGEQAIPVTVGMGATPAPNIVLSSADVFATLQVVHSLRNFGESYALELSVKPNLKRPVTVTLSDGPQLALPMHLGVDVGLDPSLGPAPAGTAISYGAAFELMPNAPYPGHTYSVFMLYADGSSATVPLGLTSVLRTPPTPAAPAGVIASTAPTFTWALPAPVASLRLEVRKTFGPSLWSVSLPGNATSAVYNSDATATQPNLDPATDYVWVIEATDANGNRAINEAAFHVQ